MHQRLSLPLGGGRLGLLLFFHLMNAARRQCRRCRRPCHFDSRVRPHRWGRYRRLWHHRSPPSSRPVAVISPSRNPRTQPRDAPFPTTPMRQRDWKECPLRRRPPPPRAGAATNCRFPPHTAVAGAGRSAAFFCGLALNNASSSAMTFMAAR
jgi:hypothetical protein